MKRENATGKKEDASRQQREKKSWAFDREREQDCRLPLFFSRLTRPSKVVRRHQRSGGYQSFSTQIGARPKKRRTRRTRRFRNEAKIKGVRFFFSFEAPSLSQPLFSLFSSYQQTPNQPRSRAPTPLPGSPSATASSSPTSAAPTASSRTTSAASFPARSCWCRGRRRRARSPPRRRFRPLSLLRPSSPHGRGCWPPRTAGTGRAAAAWAPRRWRRGAPRSPWLPTRRPRPGRFPLLLRFGEEREEE